MVNVDVLQVWSLLSMKSDFELVERDVSWVLELFLWDHFLHSSFMTIRGTHPRLLTFIKQKSLPLSACQQKEKRLLGV